ncbi:hypothetical protein ACMD2_21522, partial [Ananas comosus]
MNSYTSVCSRRVDAKACEAYEILVMKPWTTTLISSFHLVWILALLALFATVWLVERSSSIGDSVGFTDISFTWMVYVIPIYEEITKNFASSPVTRDHLPPRDKLLLRFDNFVASTYSENSSLEERHLGLQEPYHLLQ